MKINIKLRFNIQISLVSIGFFQYFVVVLPGPAGDTTAPWVAFVGREIPLGYSEGGAENAGETGSPLGMVGAKRPVLGSCLFNLTPVKVLLTKGDDWWYTKF